MISDFDKWLQQVITVEDYIKLLCSPITLSDNITEQQDMMPCKKQCIYGDYSGCKSNKINY